MAAIRKGSAGHLKRYDVRNGRKNKGKKEKMKKPYFFFLAGMSMPSLHGHEGFMILIAPAITSNAPMNIGQLNQAQYAFATTKAPTTKVWTPQHLLQ
jgi:hypothetical protein